MIIAERKPFEQILNMIAPYKKVLLLGCDTCVAICWAGGEKEVGILASQIKLAREKAGQAIDLVEATVERQCEKEMLEDIKDQVEAAEVVISLACGAGIQTTAEVFEDTPVVPGVNTTFLGRPEGEGLWLENCGHCGDCVLDKTGAVCPMVRCAKGLLNGPCGGTRKGGKCEIDQEKDCAWTLIYDRLAKQGRLELMETYYPPKNHRAVKRPGRIEAMKA